MVLTDIQIKIKKAVTCILKEIYTNWTKLCYLLYLNIILKCPLKIFTVKILELYLKITFYHAYRIDRSEGIRVILSNEIHDDVAVYTVHIDVLSRRRAFEYYQRRNLEGWQDDSIYSGKQLQSIFSYIIEISYYTVENRKVGLSTQLSSNYVLVLPRLWPWWILLSSSVCYFVLCVLYIGRLMKIAANAYKSLAMSWVSSKW